MIKLIKGLFKLLFVLIFACVGLAGGFLINLFVLNPVKDEDPTKIVTSGNLSIHFLEVGNNYTGDSIYIKCGDTDILVDGGSRTNSSKAIQEYVNQYVDDGVLEYVIVTHADQDHIAAFAGDGSNQSLFDMYEVKTIIDFPKTDKSTAVLNRYVQKREAEVEQGAKHYTALECWKGENGGQRSYEIGDGVTLNILYNYYYENKSSDENNYSVCFQIEQGANKYLFTGDLEEKGEEYLVSYNTLGKVKLYKAGHHGSKTSSNDCLLEVIQPEIVVVTCVAGSVEYTQNISNTFPTQLFIDRISKWTDEVYVTTVGQVEEVVDKDGNTKYKDAGFSSMNGNVVINVNKNNIDVTCSNNNLKLKETDWFKANRTCPSAWAA